VDACQLYARDIIPLQSPKSLIDHLMTKYDVFDFRVLLLEIVNGNKNLDHHEDMDLVRWVSDYILNFIS